MNEFIQTLNKAEVQISNKIEKEINKLRFEQIAISVSHLEISLEKYLKEQKRPDLDNVYYHIGAIKGASK